MRQGGQANVKTMMLVFERLTVPATKGLVGHDTWHAHYHRVRWTSLARAMFIAAPSLETVTVRVADFPDLVWDKDTVWIHDALTGPISVGYIFSEDTAFSYLALEETYVETDYRRLGRSSIDSWTWLYGHQ